jgi:DNA-binding PadR family transcriptional regulator
MRTRDLKGIILKMFGDSEFYGYDVHKELLALDMKIEISRLYRVLKEMLREGLLDWRWEKSYLGPKKRVYRLGEKGRKELDNILLGAIRTVHMFYGKYIMNLTDQVNPVDSLCSLLVDDLKGDNLGYLTGRYSGMNELMVRQLHGQVPSVMTYFIKPDSVQIELKLDNLVFLDGTYDSVPLRKDYLDLLVVVDLPPIDTLEEALREWRRVVKQDGRLAILAPTILMNKYKDPLTIGDFVERHEHETIEKGTQIDREYLQSLIETHFKKIEESQILHITALIAS